MKLELALLVIISLVFACCKDKTDPPPPCTDNGLPCLTTEGKNTFGCKVDGVNWVAGTPFSAGGLVALSGEYDPTDGGFYLHAIQKNQDGSIYEYINLFGTDIYGTATYEMYVNSSTKTGFRDLTQDACSIYYYDTLTPGTLEVTYFNSGNSIISGRFEMTLKDISCADSLKVISNGRFDFKY